jgi:hypothetical protein
LVGTPGRKAAGLPFAGVCAVLAFLATTPYALLDRPAFLMGLHPHLQGSRNLDTVTYQDSVQQQHFLAAGDKPQ